uniref:Uncharacterized protein n=1 Tax=Avena sativa TaxID=4498 RepID=A0ACD5VD10_AVESA
MATIRPSLLPLALVAVLAASSAALAQLEIGFYSKTCPQVEQIVREEMAAPSLAGHELPPAYGDVPLLAKIFASKGLNLKDLVVLSGAHTLGTAHCPSFADRLYNATTGKDGASYGGLVDPSLDSEYADKLRLKCKSLDDRSMLSEMDPGSYRTFDTSYYAHVAKRRGLFRSDAALLTDTTTRDYVQRVATGKFDAEFFKDFRESMIKMGNVGVLTGAEGEIRNKCHSSTSVRLILINCDCARLFICSVSSDIIHL